MSEHKKNKKEFVVNLLYNLILDRNSPAKYKKLNQALVNKYNDFN